MALSSLPARVLIGVLFSGCLTLPISEDRPEYSHFVSPRPSTVELTIRPLRTGHVNAPRCGPAGKATCFSTTEIVHAAYLLEHPKGRFLIDSGLSEESRTKDLKRFSLLQRAALDYRLESGLKKALEKIGSPTIDFVFLTHAHWDHTSGLSELNHSRVVLGPHEAEFVHTFPNGNSAVVMPDHLENASVETFRWSGIPYENFPDSYDWFGDGSVVVVPLPGHTPGSIGIFVSSVKGQRLLFVGDAGWSMDAIEIPSHKLAPLSRLTDSNADVLSQTLWRLNHLKKHTPNLIIVPTHDGHVFKTLEKLSASN